jgi:hypothetical protein
MRKIKYKRGDRVQSPSGRLKGTVMGILDKFRLYIRWDEDTPEQEWACVAPEDVIPEEETKA